MSTKPTLSSIDITEAEFDRLETTGFTIDLSQVSEALPKRSVTPSQLRSILMHPSTDWSVRDEVWRHVIKRARVDQDWMMLACGLLRPGLRQAINLMSHERNLEREDLHSALVCGVIEAIASVDLADSGLARQLVTMGVRNVRASAPREPVVVGHDVSDLADANPRHPEVALWRAVDQGVISAQDAELIAATRLGGESTEDIASQYGMSRNALLRRRIRAEDRLRVWIEEIS